MEQDLYLAIDAFRLISQPQTSGAFIVSELVREISKLPRIKKIILLLPENPRDDFLFSDLLENQKTFFLFPEKTNFPHKNFRSTVMWIQFTIPKLLQKVEVTHFIAPYHQAPIFLKHRIKVITIIHDICGILQSAGSSYLKKSPYRHWINFFTTIVRSNAFVYVSDFTKQAFENLFPYAKHKPSSVIYPKPTITPPPNRTKIEGEISQWGLTFKEYFFAFGAEGLRKGTDLTLAAFAKYLQLGGKKILVLLVKTSSLDYFREQVKGFPDKVILISNLSISERDAIYAGAIALIFPSRCEGFGYPILEAMCQGCPPITLQNSPAKEIIGDSLHSLDKLQIEEIISFMQVYEKNTTKNRQELEYRLILRANEFIEQNNMAHKYFNLLQYIR
jgi:glycosyltransferase involved in cell wall biosynthesis